MSFKLWLEANEQLWFFHEDGYIALEYGTPNDTTNSQQLGFIHYRFPNNNTVELEYIKSYQKRKGYAKMLYQEFLKTLREQFPQVRFVMAKSTSQRAYNIHLKALGEPHALFQGAKRISPERIPEVLPKNSPENIPGHGVADLSRDPYVKVIHRLQ